MLQRLTRWLLLPSALVGLTMATAAAQFQIGPQIGLDFDNSDFFFGANAVFDLPWELGDETLDGNPEIYFYLLEDRPGFSQSFTLIALNALYPLGLDFANAYVGGGLLIGIFRAEFDQSLSKGAGGFDGSLDDTDVGLNTKFGVEFGKEYDKYAPWVEAGLHIRDGGGLWAQGGVRLRL